MSWLCSHVCIDWHFYVVCVCVCVCVFVQSNKSVDFRCYWCASTKRCNDFTFSTAIPISGIDCPNIRYNVATCNSEFSWLVLKADCILLCAWASVYLIFFFFFFFLFFFFFINWHVWLFVVFFCFVFFLFFFFFFFKQNWLTSSFSCDKQVRLCLFCFFDDGEL